MGCFFLSPAGSMLCFLMVFLTVSRSTCKSREISLILHTTAPFFTSSATSLSCKIRNLIVLPHKKSLHMLLMMMSHENPKMRRFPRRSRPVAGILSRSTF
ncbi:hypothetical protein DB868_00750 [Salmonella enterica]|nr:hypothetical protein [Salmonella enterica]